MEDQSELEGEISRLYAELHALRSAPSWRGNSKRCDELERRVVRLIWRHATHGFPDEDVRALASVADRAHRIEVGPLARFAAAHGPGATHLLMAEVEGGADGTIVELAAIGLAAADHHSLEGEERIAYAADAGSEACWTASFLCWDDLRLPDTGWVRAEIEKRLREADS